ncbi:exopolysaccharide biosynthesis protein [Alteromonas sp. 1_MG-2023]|uniref:exopolysaccharide biosynthesis protein n=1 Tax=Alteromonas sp. 1_MG-2023 TaxID=3062669 RepID=UPI0026E12092|nr:exopolysaccharide biosynthesis protein [Alteromonas sp. 1_MG-2023]MDO6566109.1 exopolysaccharide biosynthesis protein [Alteromonas sp. 1_MG-2023]
MNESISGLLDKLVDEDGGEKQSAADIIARFEDRGFGPLLLIPSLIALLPTGAIPGVPSLCGITLFLICIQVALGRSTPWLPNKITNQEIQQDKLQSAVERAKPYVKKTEKLLKPRFTALSKSPWKNMVAAYCAFASLCMIPLEVVPFAVALPASALTLTAIGMTNRDGVFIGLGMIIQLGTVYLTLTISGLL